MFGSSRHIVSLVFRQVVGAQCSTYAAIDRIDSNLHTQRRGRFQSARLRSM
jgi:hypothetical protein